MVDFRDLKTGKVKLVFGDPEQIKAIKGEQMRLECEKEARNNCTTCDGSGTIECDECQGEGRIVCDECGGKQ
jgi:RecJ-like exonuclease